MARGPYKTSSGHRGNGADRLHEAEGVPLRVVLDDLPVGDADDRDSRRRNAVARRRHPEQLAVVRSAGGPTCGNVVALHNLMVKGDREIGERGAIAGYLRLRRFDAADRLGLSRVVPDVLLAVDLVGDAQV